MTGRATYQNINASGYARVHNGDTYNTNNYNFANGPDDEQRMNSLKFFNPRITKGNILLTKEKLFTESSRWILSHQDYREWYSCEGGRLLWISGDPGKGKTMLLMGITDELEQRICGSEASSMMLSYFFCRGSDSTLNNATSVLKGLIYMLIEKEGSLASHLSDKFDIAFCTEANAFFVLSQVLESILDSIGGLPTYLVIDALDECENGLLDLLRFIGKQASKSTSRVKWLVSIRKNQGIREQLERADSRIMLSLELNEASVESAVEAYINYKALELTKFKGYTREVSDKIKAHLHDNSNGTFLWVAITCKTLEENSRAKALKNLETMPPGLAPLYKTMKDKVRNQCDGEDVNLCKRIIALMTVAYQSVHLSGLGDLVVGTAGQHDWSGSLQDLEDLVNLCGSFLVVRDSFIYWVHQSAMDYVMADEVAFVIPNGPAAIHQETALHSLQAMSNTLRKDIYNIKNPGISAPVKAMSIEPDPLIPIQYSCKYWADHFFKTESLLCKTAGLSIENEIDQFLRKHLLHWLEALSLIGCIPKGMRMIIDLRKFLERTNGDRALCSLIQDVERFVLFSRHILQSALLQVYVSALIFAPSDSLIKKLFHEQKPSWIETEPTAEKEWSPCLMTLEAHKDSVLSVVFLPNSGRLASVSPGALCFWEVETGTLLWEREGGHCLTFTSDEKWLACAAEHTVKVWECVTGEQVHEIFNPSRILCVKFLPQKKRLALASIDKAVRVWNVEKQTILQVIESYIDINPEIEQFGQHASVVFSPDGQWFATPFDHGKLIRMQMVGVESSTPEDIGIQEYIYQSLHSFTRIQLALSGDGQQLAVAFCAPPFSMIKLVDIKAKKVLRAFSNIGTVAAISHNGQWIATTVTPGYDFDLEHEPYIQIWNTRTGALKTTIRTKEPKSAQFFDDGRRLISGSVDGIVKIWDLETGPSQRHLDHENLGRIKLLSHGAPWVAYHSSDYETTLLWNSESGSLNSLPCAYEPLGKIKLSPDGRWLAVICRKKELSVWDTETGTLLLTEMRKSILSITFTSEGRLICYGENEAETFDLDHRERESRIKSFVFSEPASISSNGKWLATIQTLQDFLSMKNPTVQIWDLETGSRATTLQVRPKFERDSTIQEFGPLIKCDWEIEFSHDESLLLAYTRGSKILLVWDVQTGDQRLLTYVDGFHNNLASVRRGRWLILYFASVVSGGVLEIWDMETQQRKRRLLDGRLEDLTFSNDAPLMHTDIGTFTLGEAVFTEGTMRQVSYGLNINRSWITWNGQNLIWLPPEYRPKKSIVNGRRIMIEPDFGPLLTIQFKDGIDPVDVND